MTIITIIGRGHSGTRAISHTLSQSGVYMGAQLNKLSWKYQGNIIKATPLPAHTIKVRFEDFVLRQDETLKRLEEYLGFPLAKIPVKPEAVGRWKTDERVHYFDFFREDLLEEGYISE